MLKQFFIVLLSFQICNGATPIVMWHGMGDACCLPYSLGPFKKFLEEQISGVYVKSLMIGDSVAQDLENGYFMEANKQINDACKQLADDPHLKDGFHAVGFSQGSQFMRAVVQRCGHRLPKIMNLVSLGGQHQGVYGIPNCGSLAHEACDYIRRLLNHAAYFNWVQHFLVQASYWHDPLNEDEYKKYSIFLADINNEISVNNTYIDNLSKLQNFIMVKFENDSIVDPRETEWFGFYKPGQAQEIMTLQDSPLYQQDRLGLKKMDKDGRLVFLSSPGNHLQFSEDWFVEKIINPYLL